MLPVLSFKGKKGQGLVEYALILVLVAIVVIVVLTAMGGSVNTIFSKVDNALK
jgi:pilus assembly protein Flp/PilA